MVAQAVRQVTGSDEGAEQGSVGGRWYLRSRIGDHHHGSTYQAEDRVQGNRVELEVFRAEFFHGLDFWALNEFLDRVVSPLHEVQHRTIDSLISFGAHDGLPYLVYQSSSAFTLRSLLREQSKLPVTTVREIAEHVLLALTTAHRNDILHLGLSPERILLTLDASAARIAQVRGFGLVPGLLTRGTNTAVMTRMATTLAPAAYMSPELFCGQSVDERSDLYSLGAILYEMLTGQAPFPTDSLIDLLLAHRSEPIRAITHFRPELADDPIVAFVERLLHKQASARPSSASVCLTALNALPDLRRSRAMQFTQAQESQVIRAEKNGTATHTSAYDLPPSTTATQADALPVFEELENTEKSLRGSSHATSSPSWVRTWVAPVLLAAIVLNGILGLLLVRSSFREKEVTRLAHLENERLAERTAQEESIRARLAAGESRDSLEKKIRETASPESESAKSLPGQSEQRDAPTADSNTEPKEQTAALASEKANSEPVSPSSSVAARVNSAATSVLEPVAVSELGISVRPVDAAFIEKHGLLNAEGLLVVHIDEQGPAYKAGLRESDILQFTETAGKSILSWTPEPLRTPTELQQSLQRAQASQTRLALVIKRGSYDGLVVFVRDFAR